MRILVVPCQIERYFQQKLLPSWNVYNAKFTLLSLIRSSHKANGLRLANKTELSYFIGSFTSSHSAYYWIPGNSKCYLRGSRRALSCRSPYNRAVIVRCVNTFFQGAFRKLAPELATRIFKIHDSLFALKTISSQLRVLFKNKTENWTNG